MRRLILCVTEIQRIKRDIIAVVLLYHAVALGSPESIAPGPVQVYELSRQVSMAREKNF